MTDNSTDFFDNLGGTNAPSAVLKNPNDIVKGEVVEFYERDYIPFGKTEAEKDSNEPDGKRKQLVIILQTDHRNWANVVKVPKVDPSDANSAEKSPAEDDGKRAVYVPKGSNIQYAIGKAVAPTKTKLHVGGTLGVRVFNLKDTGKGNPLKEHDAFWTPQSAESGFFGAPPVQQPEVQAPPPAPDPTPAPVETPPAVPVGQQDPWGSPSVSSDEPPF